MRAFDQFDNEISVVAQFRSLTTDVAEIISEESANARVEGRAVGTGLVVAKHGDLADTARVFVMPPVRSGLALGANHSCLLAPYENGKVYCWGAAPAAGPATDVCGVTPCVRTARLIATEIRFEAIAAGGDQTCGLSEGALYCWGRGPVVPVGESTTPQRVPGSFTFTESFTVGRDHACALTAGGAAYCWSDNSRGQLGTGDFVAASTPTAVVSDVGFSQLSAGPQFTCGQDHGRDRALLGRKFVRPARARLRKRERAGAGVDARHGRRRRTGGGCRRTRVRSSRRATSARCCPAFPACTSSAARLAEAGRGGSRLRQAPTFIPTPPQWTNTLPPTGRRLPRVMDMFRSRAP